MRPSKGLRTVIAVNGTLVDRAVAVKAERGGHPAGEHEHRRQGPGDPRQLQEGFRLLRRGHGGGDGFFREAGLPFQINTTVTRLNSRTWPQSTGWSGDGAVAWHIFLLVPVGRGEGSKARS